MSNGEIMQIKLGATVADSLTGFTGVVTGRVEYISGCNQVLVQPTVKADGDFVESRWFDEDRLKVDDALPLKTLPRKTADGADKPAPRR